MYIVDRLRFYKFWIALIFVLQFIDGYITNYLVGKGAIEINPIMAPYAGNNWMYLAKVVGSCIAVGLILAYPLPAYWLKWVLIGFCAMIGLAIGWNLLCPY